jgi:hypothetical protein
MIAPGPIPDSDDFPGYQLGVMRVLAATTLGGCWTWRRPAGTAHAPFRGVGHLRRVAGLTWVRGTYRPMP